MSARDDYPFIAYFGGVGSIAGKPHQTEAGKQVDAILDEVDRLRDELSFANDCLTKAVGYLALVAPTGGEE